jgi:hypothetical protein
MDENKKITRYRFQIQEGKKQRISVTTGVAI